MPIYEYKCASCGLEKEVIQKINDKPLKKCLACGGVLQKMVSRTSFQLKGSGWYASGYQKKSGGETQGGSTKTTSTPESAPAPAAKDSKKDSKKKD